MQTTLILLVISQLVISAASVAGAQVQDPPTNEFSSSPGSAEA
jgi:hypothetical protein